MSDGPRRRKRWLLMPLHLFFRAGEWWVRYTERIADEQEARSRQ